MSPTKKQKSLNKNKQKSWSWRTLQLCNDQADEFHRQLQQQTGFNTKRIRATEDRSFEIIQLEEKNRKKKIMKNRKERDSLVAQW